MSKDWIAKTLEPSQLEVMDKVLDEEDARREHVVVYLSGAHAYGFPSPDSDLDLKSIHIAGTEELLGLEPPRPTFDRAEIIEGVEIDYTSNEIAHALAGILGGNGNFIERVLGATPVRTGALYQSLGPVVRRSLSRRVHRHYRGFARNQLDFLEKTPTVKKLLYVLRTLSTGIHLLKRGELEVDLARMIDGEGIGEARALIEQKRKGERTEIDAALVDAWRPRVMDLFERLDAARDTSPLPEAPVNEREVREWLIEARRARLK